MQSLTDLFPKPTQTVFSTPTFRRTLENSATVLAHSFTLLFPSTVNDDSLSAIEKTERLQFVRLAVQMRMQDRSGGGMTYEPVWTGLWFATKEDILPMVVFLPDLSPDTQEWILDIMEYVKDSLLQESVMAIVDGKGYLV